MLSLHTLTIQQETLLNAFSLTCGVQKDVLVMHQTETHRLCVTMPTLYAQKYTESGWLITFPSR